LPVDFERSIARCRRHLRELVEADLQRALKATEAAGIKIGRIELTAEKITLFVDGAEEVPISTPLDTWKASRARSS
jgi:hypothetical protein